MRCDPRKWRAPMWSPLWLRRLFPGVWTAAEIEGINRRAKRMHDEIQRYIF